MQNIVITGSLNWQDRVRIKNFIFKLKTFEIDKIISGGLRDGVDILVKKYSLEFNFNYYEIPPLHYPRTIYCFPHIFHSWKFSPKNVYARNKYLCDNADMLVMFKYDDDDSNLLNDLILKFEKHQKKVIIFD